MDDPGGAPPPSQTSSQDYLGKLTTLFPAEALSLYGLAQGIFNEEARNLAIASCLCLAALLIIRYKATMAAGDAKPQWIGIIIAAVSFILWITSIGGTFDFVSGAVLIDSKWASFLAAMWTTLVPYFYKGES